MKDNRDLWAEAREAEAAFKRFWGMGPDEINPAILEPALTLDEAIRQKQMRENA